MAHALKKTEAMTDDHIDPALRAEVENNFAAFEGRLDEYMVAHENEFALMRRGEVAGFFTDWVEALTAGEETYADGLFSIQKVTKTPDFLGSFSHVVPIGRYHTHPLQSLPNRAILG